MARIFGVVALLLAGAAEGCDICEFMGDLLPNNTVVTPELGNVSCADAALRANETHTGDELACRREQLMTQSQCCAGTYVGPKECDMCSANATVLLLPQAFLLPGMNATNVTNATEARNVSCGELSMAMWLGIGSIYVEPMNVTNETYTCPNVQEVYAGTCCLNATNGTDIMNGTNDTTGANSTDRTNGTNDTNDTNGASSTNGTNDTNDSSSSNGTNDTNGASGANGTNDTSGTNGTTGTNYSITTVTTTTITTTTTIVNATVEKRVRGSFTLQVGNATGFEANSSGFEAIKDSIVSFLDVPVGWVTVETEAVDGGRRLGSARRLADAIKVVYTIVVPADNSDASLSAESLASKMSFAAGAASANSIASAIASATGETVSVASVEAPTVDVEPRVVTGGAEASCEPALAVAALLVAVAAAL